MGGCAAAQAAGWSALCGVVQFVGQAQAITDRVAGVAGAVQAAGPLPLVVLLLAGLLALAVAWQVFLWAADLIFRYFPLVLAGVVLLVMFPH